MSRRIGNILVGLTSIAGLFALAAILSLFGYVPGILRPSYPITVILNHASGLTPDSRVRLSGIDVGHITTVQLRPSPDKGVVIEALINEGRRIPAGVKVSVQTPIIGGNPSLALDVDILTVPQMGDTLATDGSAVITGRVGTLASQFGEELRASLAEPLAQLQRLADQWTLVATNLNQLIEPRTVEEVDDGEKAGNLVTVLARADKALAQLRSGLEGLNRWVNDEQLRDHVKATAANAATMTQHVGETAEQMSELAAEAKVSLEKLTGRYIAVADDMGRAIESARKMIDQAGSGEGTVGRLLNDPAVYNNLNDALERVNLVLKDLQLMIEKWKREGVPVRL